MADNDVAGRKIVLAVVTLLVLFVAYNVFLSISRTGETRVSIEVIPGDAAVYINGKPSGKVAYVSPGAYTFRASRVGWEDYSIKVEINKASAQVGLIPSPSSKEARSYLADNPDVQLRREAIGGRNTALTGEKYEEQNPLIGLLPRNELVDHYSIDFGSSPDRPYGSFILISGSPSGRQNALEWIRSRGVDPTDLEIRFDDFSNPLVQGGTND